MSVQGKLWEQIWESQDRRCAICNREVALTDAAKYGCSFQIICKDCFNSPPSADIIIMDEWGMPDELTV